MTDRTKPPPETVQVEGDDGVSYEVPAAVARKVIHASNLAHEIVQYLDENEPPITFAEPHDAHPAVAECEHLRDDLAHWKVEAAGLREECRVLREKVGLLEDWKEVNLKYREDAANERDAAVAECDNLNRVCDASRRLNDLEREETRKAVAARDAARKEQGNED